MTLRELRNHRGLSLLDVEHQTGIHRGTLSKIERGLEVPKSDQLVALSRLYEVDATGWRPTMVLTHAGPEDGA